MPKSLLFFVAAGLAYLAQMMPLIGIFLMFLLAPFWSVILINLGFLGIVAEVLGRQVSWLWLVLPIGWYGGYAAFVAGDHAALAKARQQMAAANAGVHIAFDPAREALVAVPGNSNGDDLNPEHIVQRFAVPAAWRDYGEASGRDRYREYRLAPETVCRRVREETSFGAAGMHGFGLMRNAGKFPPGTCLLMQNAAPTQPMVRVRTTWQETRIDGLPVRVTTREIVRPDGRSVRVQHGFAAPLSWIPMPVMGCGLNSGAASWECQAAFWRSSFTPLGDADAAATALGLKPAGDVQPQASEALLVRLDALQKQALAADLAELDRVLADPVAKIDTVPFRSLQASPESIAVRADAIVGGLERAAAAGNPARDNGRNLGHLVALFAPADFARARDRLLALYRGVAGSEHWLWETDDLVARLGDYGPAALPVLAGGPGRRLRMVTAWCRMGPAAVPHIGAELTHAWQEEKAKTRDNGWPSRGMYVAMLRMGLRDAAGPPDDRMRHGDYRTAWDTVTPESPPEVCKGD